MCKLVTNWYFDTISLRDCLKTDQAFKVYGGSPLFDELAQVLKVEFLISNLKPRKID